jgi:hypothetical protein
LRVISLFSKETTVRRKPQRKTKEEGSILVNLYVPRAVLHLMDSAVKAIDTDRSKFIRHAIREKMERMGIKLQEEP